MLQPTSSSSVIYRGRLSCIWLCWLQSLYLSFFWSFSALLDILLYPQCTGDSCLSLVFPILCSWIGKESVPSLAVSMSWLPLPSDTTTVIALIFQGRARSEFYYMMSFLCPAPPLLSSEVLSLRQFSTFLSPNLWSQYLRLQKSLPFHRPVSVFSQAPQYVHTCGSRGPFRMSCASYRRCPSNFLAWHLQI